MKTKATPTYAGFWIRFLANFIDVLVIGVITTPLTVMIPEPSDQVETLAELMPVVWGLAAYILASWVASTLYYAYMTSSVWQGTLGKRALNLVVTDLQGRRISFTQSLLRQLAKIVSELLFCIGYIMIGFSARKQGLHDRLVGTYVIRRDQL